MYTCWSRGSGRRCRRTASTRPAGTVARAICWRADAARQRVRTAPSAAIERGPRPPVCVPPSAQPPPRTSRAPGWTSLDSIGSGSRHAAVRRGGRRRHAEPPCSGAGTSSVPGQPAAWAPSHSSSRTVHRPGRRVESPSAHRPPAWTPSRPCSTSFPAPSAATRHRVRLPRGGRRLAAPGRVAAGGDSSDAAGVVAPRQPELQLLGLSDSPAVPELRRPAVKAYGRPVAIRPWAEMNGDWQPWRPSAQPTGCYARGFSAFMAAWRAVVGVCWPRELRTPAGSSTPRPTATPRRPTCSFADMGCDLGAVW